MKLSLTSNQLKILALVTMTVDHIGAYLLPDLLILRIIGRLALPIYAYMIAEGCKHTRNRRKYLLQMAGMAALCQLVYFFAMGSLYQCILVTFTLSILLIYAYDTGSRLHLAVALLGVAFVTVALPRLLQGTDFAVDYGFFGVLVPVLTYFGEDRRQKLVMCAVALVFLACVAGGIQWLGLLALVPLALYNGQRGKARMKGLFYWYYPLHLVAIYGVGLLI